MKYVDEFRDKKLVRRISDQIKEMIPSGRINIMEVCGTHTQNFCRFALDQLLPENLKLISGPGCPVCVSSQEYVDQAVAYARRKDIIVLTFADMLRVPGRESSLEQERAKGAKVFAVYSPTDALKFAQDNPGKKIIFLGVGFETTAPAIALSAIAAKKNKLKNIFFFNSFKLIPPAIKELMKDKRLNLSGFLCPGHVSAIIGTRPYDFIPDKYRIGCCVAGFEPLDILEGLYLLVKQLVNHKPAVDNQYVRVVSRQGNIAAQKILRQVFRVYDANWRGLGKIPGSGLKFGAGFSAFDAQAVFPVKLTALPQESKKKCRCAEILKGLIRPSACSLFSQECSPEKPVGPCMVSYEGACNAYYRYKR